MPVPTTMERTNDSTQINTVTTIEEDSCSVENGLQQEQHHADYYCHGHQVIFIINLFYLRQNNSPNGLC